MDKAKLISNNFYQELIVSYMQEQINDLESTDPKIIDKSRSPFFEMYQNADETNKEAVNLYIKELITDVASIILGGFDGATSIGSLTDNFRVKYNDQEIDQDLQEYFLMKVEESYDE